MRRALVFCMVAGLVSVLGNVAASASPTASGTTTFAVVERPPTAPGYTAHISGVGLNGPWLGWHFAADIAQSSDCDAGGCPIQQFAWDLYDKTPASNAEWGTCSGSPFCESASSTSVSGGISIPLTVNGGVPWSQGTGSVTGDLPPGSPDGAGAGYLTLTLDLH